MGSLFANAMRAYVAANQGGGGVTWSMTAGEPYPGEPGYFINRSNNGSLSNEPVPGAVLHAQLSRTSGAHTNDARLSFSGDVRPLVSSYTTFVVDGTSYALSGLVFMGQRTYWDVWPNPDTWPQYTIGQTYACELR
ncbi:hypothetical protein PhaeoP75_02285 [Phaeobacter gallaeciensis]|uniref:Uncharacterized protein n=1 Tax=Phaeobacter gallaeciensis TaxID=60890 RepID=A0AAC9ZA56_9RHOB|nr:hypothetical protein Gal_02244 [Phaeobacter gallaeciensis DSM 26640]ATE93255.1 hypothetical protein PhaeoP11_02235 [Phaeobacter gallaeciensis]ATE96923.1 hypothetical protein PhaeoP73_01611 [Phaeobacter gallaeciensis]ATF01920.1 hypothetical protein PhaeoP75_02285 [Phaeobacter gallaeciensis]ATF06300.1 hypothetical protein PhaeoP63_02234 [Phaeobacter gallaeciensis]